MARRTRKTLWSRSFQRALTAMTQTLRAAPSARYAATITDYRTRGRLVPSSCEVNGLGHAWSGGAAGRAYSDPKGPDVSRMI